MTNRRARLFPLLATFAMLGPSGRLLAADPVPALVAPPPAPRTGIGLDLGIGSALAYWF